MHFPSQLRVLTRVLVLLLSLALVACGGSEAPSEQPVPASEPEARELRLSGLFGESPEHALLGSSTTHHALLERIEALREDKNVRGVLVHLGPLDGAFARASELAAALERLRSAGKPVHCYFEQVDNAGYLVLARGCDRISMAPGGMLDLVGVASEVVYAAELLKTVGLRADLVQIGRYKGAADTFTRDSMPPEVRETTEALIADLHAAVVGAVVQGRRLDAARVQALIDQAPFTASQAREGGLVDDVGFDDEARLHLKQAAKVEEIHRETLEPSKESLSLSDLFDAFNAKGPSSNMTGERIALAYLDGTILTGHEDVAKSANAAPFVKALRRLGDLPDVRAVVLRIDSPGGSALAADAMWHAVRRVAKRKPVIVSIGDLAASGGYYVACAGTRILADDDSIVGSIGVVGGKIVGEDLGTRLGVRSERIGRGQRAGWMSVLHAFSDDERTAFTGLLEDTYERFIDRIVEGRNLPRERILPLAEGRIMSGRRAREGGLVDERGGLTEALALARKLGKLSADSPIEVWPGRQSLLDQIAQLAGSPTALSSNGAASWKAASAWLPAPLQRGLLPALITGDDRQLVVLPFAVHVR